MTSSVNNDPPTSSSFNNESPTSSSVYNDPSTLSLLKKSNAIPWQWIPLKMDINHSPINMTPHDFLVSTIILVVERIVIL